MKVRITEDTKKSIYASQLAAARKIVESMKEDDGLEEEDEEPDSGSVDFEAWKKKHDK